MVKSPLDEVRTVDLRPLRNAATFLSFDLADLMADDDDPVAPFCGV